MNKYRLRQSVGIVVQNNVTEFFKANVRNSTKIKIGFTDIINLLQLFDGKTPLNRVAEQYPGLNREQLNDFVTFLNKEHVLILNNVSYTDTLKNEQYRLINTLEEFCYSSSEVIECLDKITSSKVVIIGAGAVGSNIAAYLASCGVGEIILIDNDVVDISNLHRQFFFEEDIGHKKALTLATKLQKINPSISVTPIDDKIDTTFFDRNQLPNDVNVIINCSDEPSVDFTSEIIAKYCMPRNIPHIVGGGYNLHQTLIGQTIIPYETACFNCFSLYLNNQSAKELKNVKKLHRDKRKLGSFSPLSGIAATLASLDALKLIIDKKQFLQQTNKRVEFNLRHNEFNSQFIPKDPSCAWCSHEKNDF